MENLVEFAEETELVFADTSSPSTGYVRLAGIQYSRLDLVIEPGCPHEFLDAIRQRHQELWLNVGKRLTDVGMVDSGGVPILDEKGVPVVLGYAIHAIV